MFLSGVMDLVPNISQNHSTSCSPFDSCDKFGTEEIVDVVFLVFYSVFGTIGNLLVIFSLINEKKIHKQGNVYIVNLAAADLFMCAVTMPSIIINIVTGKLSLSEADCDTIGYISIVTWVCTIYTLSVLVLNRCWCVMKFNSRRVFMKNFNIILVFVLWLWSVLVTSPLLMGWSNLKFDFATNICLWNENISAEFNAYFVVLALILPSLFIVLCYCTLLWKIKSLSQLSQIETNSSSAPSRGKMLVSRLKQNETMLKILVVVVVAFLISWIPYWVVVLCYSKVVSFEVKKVFLRLGMSNSVMNFVIYWFLNPAYRRGYKKLLYKLSCCKKHCQCLLVTEVNSRDSGHRQSKSFMFQTM